MHTNERSSLTWNMRGRVLAFILASTSIWCLLAEFYGLCSMRAFALVILIPATLLLAGLALRARSSGGFDWRRGVWIGALAGLIAAVAYDVFRLPFVYATAWHIDSVVPPMKLFKVFPRFGAMLLGQPIEQPAYSLAAHLLGWAYHFSNGATFGIMYTALVGDVTRRSWGWAVLFAAGLEAAMLLTPYPRVFGTHLTAAFIAATFTAHIIFGIGLGLVARGLGRAVAPRSGA